MLFKGDNSLRLGMFGYRASVQLLDGGETRMTLSPRTKSISLCRLTTCDRKRLFNNVVRSVEENSQVSQVCLLDPIARTRSTKTAAYLSRRSTRHRKVVQHGQLVETRLWDTYSDSLLSILLVNVNNVDGLLHITKDQIHVAVICLHSDHYKPGSAKQKASVSVQPSYPP